MFQVLRAVYFVLVVVLVFSVVVFSGSSRLAFVFASCFFSCVFIVWFAVRFFQESILVLCSIQLFVRLLFPPFCVLLSASSKTSLVFKHL